MGGCTAAVVRFSQYERLASHNRLRHEPGLAPRGGVFDQRGKLLAGSRIAHRVAILNLADPARQLASRHAPTAGEAAVDFASAVALARLPQPSLNDQLAELAALLQLNGGELTAIRRSWRTRTGRSSPRWWCATMSRALSCAGWKSGSGGCPVW